MDNDDARRIVQQHKVTDEVALSFLIKALAAGEDLSHYGYEVYITSVIDSYCQSQLGLNPYHTDASQRYSAPFLNALWELCRRGILRPGTTSLLSQSTDPGSAGGGCSFTSFGRMWLSEPHHSDF